MLVSLVLMACAPAERPLPAAGLTLRVDEAGVDAGGVRAGLRGFGRGDEGRAAGEARVLPSRIRAEGGARLSRSGAGWTEHFDCLSAGFEQTVVLEHRPAGEGTLWLDTALAGLDAQGRDARGSLWSLGGLAVWDADGRALPATMDRAPSGVRVRVDDRGARYPLTVDPIYATAWITVVGNRNENLGTAVRAVGDLTGDGIDDLAVGVPGYDNGRGTVRLYYGGAPTSTHDQHLDGDDAGDYFGAALAPAGDVNGDGYADLVVGATGRNTSTGAAYLYPGAAGGPGPTETVTWEGVGVGDTLGFAVAGGDLDGDGFSDVVVGAPGTSFYTGVVQIYRGGSAGPGTVADWSLTPTVNRPRLGGSLAVVPDLDGDGDAELLVGAYGASSFTGAVYLYTGDPAGPTLAGSWAGAAGSDTFGWALATGDVNGDGRPDMAVASLGANNYAGRVELFLGDGAGFATSASWTASGTSASQTFGQSVAFLGDLEGDGDDELVIGASNAASTGTASVYYGAPAGPAGTPDVRFSGDLAAEYGAAVTAGDFDADGYPDLAVGAPAGSGGGQLWVYRGYDDADGDGIGTADDCDDTDPGVGAPTRGYADADGDGFGAGPLQDFCGEDAFASVDGDCDDGEPNAWPGNTEVDGDGVDGDCDGLERCYADADGDGYRTDAPGAANDGDCADPGEATGALPGGDCDDGVSYAHPGSAEICDGIDDDCDGNVDGSDAEDATEWQADADGDGYTDPALSVVDCEAPSGYIAPSAEPDCDDMASFINPGVAEIEGDGIDQNCDGSDGVSDTGIPATDKDCGCAGVAGGPAPLWLLGLGALARRRRAGAALA